MRARFPLLPLLLTLPALAAPRTVGPDGDPRRLRIEGAVVVSADELRNALALDIPTQLAGTPAAPLSEYLFAVQSRLTLGYQRCGFPQAKVAVSIDPAGGPLAVRVAEGPRFLAGD